MKTTLAIGIAALFAATAGLAGAAEVHSLRGNLPLNAPAKEFGKKKQFIVNDKVARNWKLQPPIIPHKIDKERINLDENTCFRCHSPDTYKAEKAPMISKTHFKNPDKPVEKELIKRRYYCYQCHVPQVDAKPLVENTFKSAGK